MKKVLTSFKSFIFIYCMVYSLSTMASSAIQIYEKQYFDSNYHNLNRAAVVLIGLIVLSFSLKINFEYEILSWLFAYILSVPSLFGIVYVTGLYQELHKNAYRDIFLNFTVVFLLVATIRFCYGIIKSIRRKHKS